MNKYKFGVFALITLLTISFALSVGLVGAQNPVYTTQKTIDVTLDSSGTFSVSVPDVGVSIQITGTPGATGTVTVTANSGNPQPTANIPDGTSLTSFITIAFDMNPNDFSSATITLNYTNAMVQNLKQPYAIYKYDANSNSYVALPSTVDTTAKTITVTLTSITDPVLAIGGATIASGGGVPTSTWIIIVAVVIIIVIINVFIFTRMRHRSESQQT